MIFTIETKVLRKLVRLANRKMPAQHRRDAVLKVGATGAFAYVEANETVAAVEALAMEEGECAVPIDRFEAVLKTFGRRRNLTISGSENGLVIGRFLMPVLSYSARPSHPSERLLFSHETSRRVSEPEYPTEIAWSWFSPDVLETLFSVYGRDSEVEWASRMWERLQRRQLTTCSNSIEFNAVLGRLAVLARFYRAWVWHAGYGGGDDPAELCSAWYDVLPLVRSGFEQNRFVSSGGELLARLMAEQNDSVFSAIITDYEDPKEINFALDLRYAAGIADEFSEQVALDQFTGKQEQFFEECGLSFREFDCLSLIGNHFVF